MEAKRPTLGVVVISYNEERDLPAFLEHLQPWVDEIVLVDDESTDRTAEIAQAAGGKVRLTVHKMEAEKGFAGQRNFGIESAASDWLLHMDVDERVPPSLAREILGAVSLTGFNAFRYRRKNFFLHRPMRGGGWQKWNAPQLACRGAHFFKNKVHERCVVRGGEAAVGQLKSPMWHLCDEGYRERLSKSLEYSQHAALNLLESGKHISWVDLLWQPLREFLKKYVAQQGFRDGVPGLISSLHASSAVFRAHALTWDEQNFIDREALEEELRAQWHKEGSLG